MLPSCHVSLVPTTFQFRPSRFTHHSSLLMIVLLPSRVGTRIGIGSLQAPFDQNEDAVGLAREAAIVGDHDDRLSLLAMELFQHPHDLPASLEIEVAGGF